MSTSVFFLAMLLAMGGTLFGIKSCSDREHIARMAWEETHCQYKTVADVGGCDRWGICSVRFDDGTIGADYVPLRGGAAKWCNYDGTQP